jgi:hypothetical protein
LPSRTIVKKTDTALNLALAVHCEIGLLTFGYVGKTVEIINTALVRSEKVCFLRFHEILKYDKVFY